MTTALGSQRNPTGLHRADSVPLCSSQTPSANETQHTFYFEPQKQAERLGGLVSSAPGYS